jgi:hypothetical protein
MIYRAHPNRDEHGPYVDLESPTQVMSAQALGASAAIFLDAEGHEIARQRPGRCYPVPREVSRVRFVEREPGSITTAIVTTADPTDHGVRILPAPWA